MGNYKNIYQYRAALNQRINTLKKTSKKTNRDICKLIQKRAQRFAPADSRQTIRGIRLRKMAQGWQVESWVPGRFKQNLWANRTPPYDRLVVKNDNGAIIPPNRSRTGNFAKVANKNEVLIYGRSPSRWRWTGKPGFFDWAVDKTRRDGFKMHVRNSRKAIRAY